MFRNRLPRALLAVLASAPMLATTMLATTMLSTTAFAATPIDQTRPLAPRGRIEIDNLKGRIQVRAWNRDEVRITGSLGEGVEKLVIDGDRDHLVVRVQYPRHIGAWRGDRTGPTDLRLQVPLQADLEIESVSADIDVDGVAPGQFDIDTVSGNVVAAAAPGSADINSVSGDLQVTLNSRDVKVETVSGDVSLHGRLDGEVHGETVSGTLSINSRSQRLRKLNVATVSGDTDLRVALADGGELRAETVSGDIRVSLPKTLSAQVSGESFSGDLRAPGAKVGKEEFGPGSSFRQRYGNGAGKVHMETFSGDAELTLN